MQIDIRRIYRCQKIVRTRVRNALGQDVGYLDDLVMDLEANRIAYGILAYGGFFGLGARRFAVPWDEYSLQFDEDRKHFLLDVDPSKLMQVRSLTSREQLDFSHPNFQRDADDVYQQIRRSRGSRPSDPQTALHRDSTTDRSAASASDTVRHRDMELPEETILGGERVVGTTPGSRPGREGSPLRVSDPPNRIGDSPPTATNPAAYEFQDRLTPASRSDSALP